MGSVIAVGQNTNTCDLGGILYGYATDASNITAATIGSDGEITALTMSSSGLWAKLYPDDEANVAAFNEESTLNGKTVEVAQSATIQFNGLTQAKIKAANFAMACCGLVVIWVGNDGSRRVQGIEVDNSQGWKLTKQRCRLVASANSGTAADGSLLIYNFQSTSRYLGPTTTLTDSAIEAL